MDDLLCSKGQVLYKKARNLIPGGTQLISKQPEFILPDLWPAYYSSVKGCLVKDISGKEYIDMSHNAVGSCILGAADDDVNKAVINSIKSGVNSTLNCPEEVDLAELLCEIHPWASKVRYARTGGEIMAMAVRIGRASSGRDKVAFCGYHGWHDWYLAANIGQDCLLNDHALPGLTSNGVPRGLRGTALPFRYNHINELEEILAKNRGEVGVIVMEPVRSDFPKDNFLQRVRDLATKHNIVLIFDEISSGFRLSEGGAHLILGVNPDIAVFAKGISNGHPMAALVGTDQVMDAVHETFITSTYWSDKVGPSAALATVRKLRKFKVYEHICAIGEIVQAGWRESASKNGLAIKVSGIPPLSSFGFDHEKDLTLQTIFAQEMLKRGYLGTNYFYPTYTHSRDIVRIYLEQVDEVFNILAAAIKSQTVNDILIGRTANSGFTRLT